MSATTEKAEQDKDSFWKTLGLLLLWVFAGVPLIGWVYLIPVNFILGLVDKFLSVGLAKIVFVALLITFITPFLASCYIYPYILVRKMILARWQKRLFTILLVVFFVGTLLNFLIVPLSRRFA